MNDKAAATDTGSSALQFIKWSVVVALIGLAVWGNAHYSDISPFYRALGVVAVVAVAAFVALQTEQGRAFNSLRKEAMVEIRKVVWPTRQEAVQTTLIVLAFVVLVAIMLFFFDWILSGLIARVIG